MSSRTCSPRGHLGDLGDDVRRFFTDPDKDVRVCATLAPSVAHDETATVVIIAALSDEADRMSRADPPEPDNGPVDRLDATWPAGVRGYSLGELISAALARAGFHRIAEPATRIIRHTDRGLVDSTWGQLVRAAFPEGPRRRTFRRRARLSGVQRDVVAALVANPRIWDYKNGNISGVFMDSGLPFQREVCLQIAQDS